eukprot:3807359-Pleurochrysis_carterae.AAC.1
MDWGLPQRAKSERARGICGYTLREPLLVTRSPAAYGLLCVVNLLLRFAWTLSIFAGVKGYGAGMFFFEVIEVFRRTVWAVFRIEWEVIVKVYSTAQETKHLTSGDSEASEEQGLEAAKDLED